MKLEEAIIHSREVAKEKRSEGCIECANEHKQLAAWLEELKMLRKAYDLMAEELAVNKHCVMFPNCYNALDEEDCMLKEACHNKEWLKDYYLQKAWEENENRKSDS